MKENAKKQHEIDRENFNSIKADSKERLDAAKKVDPDFQEFLDAKGLKAKAKVVTSHIERDGIKRAEENRENYKKMLSEQRKNMNNIINGKHQRGE